MPTIQDYFGTSLPKDITVKIPLQIGNTLVGYENLSENELQEVINFNLKSVILTNKGERFDTNFGVGLQTYLFEQFNEDLRQTILSEMKSQIETYLPYLNKFNITLTSNNEKGFLFIKIKYKINEPEVVGYFDINLPLAQI